MIQSILDHGMLKDLDNYVKVVIIKHIQVQSNLIKAIKIFLKQNVSGNRIVSIEKIDDNKYVINGDVIDLKFDEDNLRQAITIFSQKVDDEDHIYLIKRITDTLYRINDREVNIANGNVCFCVEFGE